jgi:hypothetical protein
LIRLMGSARWRPGELLIAGTQEWPAARVSANH